MESMMSKLALLALSASLLATTACSADAAPPAAKNAAAANDPEIVAAKKKLTPDQFRITQESGTEPPFHNAFGDNHAAGIYVDVVSGEPLFSSTDKFDSGTGWPSFTRPLEKDNVASHGDDTYGMSRTEVRS